MKDLHKVNYKPRDSKIDWVSKGHYTSVFPILKQPAKSRQDIYGAAFLIDYKGKRYAITAKHVVDIDNPVLLLTGYGRVNIYLETQYFNKLGIDWVFHVNVDLAVIPLKIPSNFKRVINTSIKPKLSSVDLKPDQIVKHLGYPDKMTGHWTDTNAPNNISSGALGKILENYPNRIVVSTPAHEGDSGGPLFLKIQNGAKLIGVVTTTKVLSKNTYDPEDAVYLGKTTAIPISFAYDIIDSDKIKAQV